MLSNGIVCPTKLFAVSLGTSSISIKHPEGFDLQTVLQTQPKWSTTQKIQQRKNLFNVSSKAANVLNGSITCRFSESDKRPKATWAFNGCQKNTKNTIAHFYTMILRVLEVFLWSWASIEMTGRYTLMNLFEKTVRLNSQHSVNKQVRATAYATKEGQ